jgi:hypothetical protein
MKGAPGHAADSATARIAAKSLQDLLSLIRFMIICRFL